MKAIVAPLFVVIAAWVSPAWAGPADDCIACHAKATEKTAAGKPAKVTLEDLAGSVHKRVKGSCVACHEDVAPGKDKHGAVKPANCASCHEDEAKQYAATLHGKAKAGGKGLAASCADCHGSHDIRKSEDPKSKTGHANIDATCSACHGSDAMVKKGNLPGGNIGKQYADSIHAKAIHEKKLDKAPTCSDCHGAHDMRAKADPESPIHKAKIVETCGTCHAKAKKAYLKSTHGKLKSHNVQSAPGCTDCHGAHGVKDHDLPKWQVDVIKECGTCHLDYIKSYRDTYHGQVTELGFARMATCSSCHGFHEILPKDNPDSKVSDRNRLATCQACHPKANANFVKFEPHANKHSLESGPALYYTTKFMQFLLAGVFTFFGLHTILWLYRSLKVVAARRAAGGQEEKH